MAKGLLLLAGIIICVVSGIGVALSLGWTLPFVSEIAWLENELVWFAINFVLGLIVIGLSRKTF